MSMGNDDMTSSANHDRRYIRAISAGSLINVPLSRRTAVRNVRATSVMKRMSHTNSNQTQTP